MKRMLKGWRFMRIIRLLVGLYFCWEGLAMKEWLLGLAGLLITWMALADADCSGPKGCQNINTTPPSPENTSATQSTP